MAMITNDWLTALGGEFHKPYYRQLFEFVKNEYNTTVVFPPADDIFNAFHFTPLSKVKVLILGQDPYHEEGQAHGLCFSVKPNVDIPPSLQNIYKELHDDLGLYIPNNGFLEKWAKQGVLVAWMAVPAALLIICAVSLKFYPLAGEKWDETKRALEANDTEKENHQSGRQNE